MDQPAVLEDKTALPHMLSKAIEVCRTVRFPIGLLPPCLTPRLVLMNILSTPGL